MHVTASMLYDLVSCPHRVTMDLFTDPAGRDRVSPFVEMLWSRGNLYERQVIEGLTVPVVDLSSFQGEEREARTREAMEQHAPLIYSGRISHEDLLGEPDLLRLTDAGYVPGDIKSGAGEEGDPDNGKPKKHYGVQVALYADVLMRKGYLRTPNAFIFDIHGEEVPYDLQSRRGPSSASIWEAYEQSLAAARDIIGTTKPTRPAYGASCKLCHWYSRCLETLTEADDLSLLPELGRSKRDALIEAFPNVSALAQADPQLYIQKNKTSFPGVGAGTLIKFHQRAVLKASGGDPYAREPLVFPEGLRELHFDVETDPFQDLCYLHGFVVREVDGSLRYVPFFAENHSAEEEAFRNAWKFIQDNQPSALYYYSPYEKTTFRHLQKKYPTVCTPEDVEALFRAETSIDLYLDVVKKRTEWPTRDHSIKTLAKYLGFAWRDTDPSGAASIEWFSQWQESRDPAQKQRILDYNEDDCLAMPVLLDGLKALQVRVD
jgi:predicted RecB family nuclease